MKNYSKGAEWRRWDLHIHTPGTNKNDKFKGNDLDDKWNNYCSDINDYEGEISVIGITDYWSIENYFVFKEKLVSGAISKNIEYVIPNVEMRVTPITGSGKPVNIHCLFNPALDSELEDRFFQKLTISHGREFSATRSDMVNFGRDLSGDNQMNPEQAYKLGIENLVVEWRTLETLFKKDEDLRRNTVIVVSNKSTDGASGVIQHKDFFTDAKLSQLESHRRGIYKLSDAIFSSRPKDAEFFYGDSESYARFCGKPKPCFHGSDAHDNKKLFEPDEQRYCWVKADPTFEGLLQTLNEPRDRVFIGLEPPVVRVFEENKTKYIKAITIDSLPSYNQEQGAWFDGVRLSFNKQLVAIIGNKGSGKSAVADILALCGETSTPLEFLTNKKFKKHGLAAKFSASMYWDDGSESTKGLAEDVNASIQERVKYLSQNNFETLCSEIDQIEGFRKELEHVVFSHIPVAQRYGCTTFEGLVDHLKGNSLGEIMAVKAKLQQVNEKISILELRRNEKYINKLKSQLELKDMELDAHDGIVPEAVENPNKGEKSAEQSKQSKEAESLQSEIDKVESRISEAETENIEISIALEKLRQIKLTVQGFEKTVSEQRRTIEVDLIEYKIPIDDVIGISVSYGSIDAAISVYVARSKEISADLNGGGPDEGRGLHDTLKILGERKVKILKDLGAPEKRYQKYLSDLSGWQLKRKVIEGDAGDPATLTGIKSALSYISDGLQVDIDKCRAERSGFVREIFSVKSKLVEVYKNIKVSIDASLSENHDLLGKYDVAIKSCFEFEESFIRQFQGYISQNIKGSFYGKEAGQLKLRGLLETVDLSEADNLIKFFDTLVDHLEKDYRDLNKKQSRYIDDQVQDLNGFYNYLYSLDYLTEAYSLEMGGKQLQQLSPGEKGALLLIFYLLLDKDNKPLIIDQPEDNLDNQSVSRILVPFIKKAKLRRQIFMVTHNPNLAVVADAEQVIHVNIEKDKGNRVTVNPGAIESLEVNRAIVDILEGTMPAFRKRDNKYMD